MNLFDKVEDRIDKKIRIGIIIKNDKDEILLVKNSIERINKDNIVLKPYIIKD